ncbi:hypothetical protein ACHAO5_002677 [Verticillium nonalfalfae]
MEPPVKRQRLSHTPTSRLQHEDDELDFESENVDHQRDSGLQLAESRAFAAYKLKSTFEHIFEKYERDFTGIGDEIDLRTGEIVVDNGHIQRLGLGGVDSFLEEDEGMLLEDAVLPPLQQTSKDEQSTQKKTFLEVPDSDCLDDNLESSLREVSQSLASTQDKDFAVQSPTLPLASETICSSKKKKTKQRKRKTKTCIPVSEKEHSAIVQLSQAPQAEADVVGADIPRSSPLAFGNKEPEKQKNSTGRITAPQGQILTPQRPSSRRSILSLRPGDAEEDEISLILDSWSTPRTGSALPPRVVNLSSIRKSTLAKLAGSSPLRSRGSIMSPTGLVASGGGGSGLRFRTAREGFGGMSTPTKRKRLASPGSQAGSLIRTPGGQLRRCGVDGFSCDRDFCFTCLQG